MIDDGHRDALARDGFVRCPGLLSPTLVAAMRPVVDDIVGLGPRGDDDAAIRRNSRRVFPFDDFAMASSCLDEALLAAAAKLLGVDDPILCESTLYARFAERDVVGERELSVFHTHWDGSALVPPPPTPRAGVLAVNVFWFETTARNAPMLLVRRSDVPQARRADRADTSEQSLAPLADPAFGQPGDVLFYELDTYHKSTPFLDPQARRVTHRIVYAAPTATWACRRVPGASDATMRELLTKGTPAQRAALGVPPELAGYWQG